MRLLDLVEENDGVGLAADPLRHLPPLLVPDVAGRRADQLRDGVLLHVLGHVEADEGARVVEEELGEPPRHLGFPDARGAEEDERAHRPVRVLHAETRAPDGAADGLNGGVLPDDPLLERFLHVEELLGFLDLERRDRDPGPARDDLLDVGAGDVRGLGLVLARVFVRSISSLISISRSRRKTARSKSFSEIAFFISLTICFTSFSRRRRFCVSAVFRSFTFAPASSRMSIALSGKKRSGMYRLAW